MLFARIIEKCQTSRIGFYFSIRHGISPFTDFLRLRNNISLSLALFIKFSEQIPSMFQLTANTCMHAARSPLLLETKKTKQEKKHRKRKSIFSCPNFFSLFNCTLNKNYLARLSGLSSRQFLCHQLSSPFASDSKDQNVPTNMHIRKNVIFSEGQRRAVRRSARIARETYPFFPCTRTISPTIKTRSWKKILILRMVNTLFCLEKFTCTIYFYF